MRSFLNRTLIALILGGLTFSAGTAQTSSNHSPLTNAAIVKLVRAGFKEKTILSIITASPPAYELSPERMIELKRNGVSERIILQMLARQEDMVRRRQEPMIEERLVRPDRFRCFQTFAIAAAEDVH